ncbi:M16 family metallopeptidase [Flaviflexus sp.]|uniref:M16 family metallopeptidase n=1 Tax=Flaviflexus sp. TaxID=1969482 RepID=UPI003F903B0A
MTYTEIRLADQDLDVEDSGMHLRRTLRHGIRFITEHIPTQRSVALGMWIGAGSRDEETGHEGSTHFLEHLLFKGTRNRSAIDIAEEQDFLGGDFNAMTGKQFTAYHGRVFQDDLKRAVDLLADMITSARLDREDMDVERGVILDELAMYADDPSEVAHEALPAAVFGDHSLARPVGGTKQSVGALDHGSLLEHYADHYHPGELVVAAAGAVDHEEFIETVIDALRRHGWELDGTDTVPRRIESPLSYNLSDRRIVQASEQSAVVIGMPGVTSDDPMRPALIAALTILGTGSSSRLFQEVREKRGLAYSAYALAASYETGGLVAMAAPTSPKNADIVAELMNDTLNSMVGTVKESEVESAYRRLRAGVVFDAEAAQQRMMRLGLAEVATGRLISMDESLHRQRAVTRDDIEQVLSQLVVNDRARVVVGPVE